MEINAYETLQALLQSDLGPGKVIKFKQYQRYHQAQDVLTAARQEAESINDKAKQDYQTAVKKGHQNGLTQAREEAKKIIYSANTSADELLSSARQGLIALIRSVVEKVIAAVPAQELVQGLVYSAVEKLREEKKITLYLPPDTDLDKNKLEDNIKQKFNSVEKVEVETDAALSSGNYVVESESAVVKVSLDDTMEKVMKLIEDGK